MFPRAHKFSLRRILWVSALFSLSAHGVGHTFAAAGASGMELVGESGPQRVGSLSPVPVCFKISELGCETALQSELNPVKILTALSILPPHQGDPPYKGFWPQGHAITPPCLMGPLCSEVKASLLFSLLPPCELSNFVLNTFGIGNGEGLPSFCP